MHKQNFIVLNGFAGAGKTTIGKRYIRDHPLALLIEGDEIIVNLGQWREHEAAARQSIFELTKSMAITNLKLGYDVILPYLVTDNTHLAAFKDIADENHANFYNFMLYNEKAAAITNLLERGSFGEAGLPPLSVKDMPEIDSLYDRMDKQLKSQPGVVMLKLAGQTVEVTYSQMMAHLDKS